jgi:hypothetical protein
MVSLTSKSHVFRGRISLFRIRHTKIETLLPLTLLIAIAMPANFLCSVLGQELDVIPELIIDDGMNNSPVLNRAELNQTELNQTELSQTQLNQTQLNQPQVILDSTTQPIVEHYSDPHVIYESEYVQPGVEFGAGSGMPGTVESQYYDSTFADPINFGTPLLHLATDFSSEMLDFQNRQTSKERFLLEHSRRNGGQPMATLGFQFRGSALFAETNTADKFSYLGRFPTDFEGTAASDIRLLQANQGFSFTFSPKVHGHFETLFSDVFSFDDSKQGSFQVRQAYVVFGDFEQSPFYAYLGKKTIGFGDMGTLSPFTQAVPWHYFAALAEGGGIGFDNGRLHWSIAALNGSRGIRVSDSESRGDLNNFAANILFRIPTRREGTYAQLGAGYLNGSIYDGNTAEHLDAGVSGERNGVWDINAYAKIQRLHLAAEYLQTESPWPVTDHRVSGYRGEAAWDSQFFGSPARWSLSWSEGKQGSPGTPFEFNRQAVVGYSIQPNAYARYSLEYVRSSGFAPLMNITRASDRDVIQDSIVFGVNLTL